MRQIKITDTTLRDGHQSLWATRMTTADMLPVLEQLDEIGYHSLEVWGGATFDVCMRYLNEDPWERLRTLKKHIKKTPLQMLLRGQSLVGYQHYSDDIVEAFIHKAVENGIDIIRVFDALNDLRNLEWPIKAAKAAGAHVQGAVVYTISPVHTMEQYLSAAITLKEMGVDSLCIKDMAGLLTPYKAYELVKTLKENIDLPLQLHSHYIGGMAVGAYLKAVEAGVDVIDTASVPLAFGASQPPVETVVRVLKDGDFPTGLKMRKLFEIAQYFETLRKQRGFSRGVTRISDMYVFEHQVPGGMISNLVSQLEIQKSLHRLPEVLEEIPRVRAELGYPPLVTPTSQIVGTQAVINVLLGQRYKVTPGEVKAYVKGLYGKPPAPISPEIKQMILGSEQAIDCRPADLLEPKLAKLKEEIGNLAKSDEDVLSYALFPQVALKFLENRSRTPDSQDNANNDRDFSLGDKEDKKVRLQEIQELIKMLGETDISELKLETDGVKLSIKKGAAGMITVDKGETGGREREEQPQVVKPVVEQQPEPQVRTDADAITSPMVGTFYAAPAPDAPPFVEVGSKIKAGQTVCIIEAMKLMNEIEAEFDGEILEILVENGQPVEYGQKLFLVKKLS